LKKKRYISPAAVITQEIRDLTVCRGLFAAWVFIYHVNLHAQFSKFMGPAKGLLIHGYLGVDGFFVLSGLILARVHPEISKSLAGSFRFWGKRLARIYPVHLATIVLLICIVGGGRMIGMTPTDPQRFALVPLIENLLLVHGWGIANQWDWNYPSWSVSTEWAGYLVFPVLWFAISFWSEIIAGELCVVAVPILGLLEHVSGHGLNLTFATALWRFFPEFVMGIATARLVPLTADHLPSKWLLVAGACFAVIGALFGWDVMTVEGIWLGLAALTMWADTGRKPMFGQARVLHMFGLLSYAFYMSFAISELLLAQVFRHAGWDPAGHKLAYTGAMTLVTLMLAVALHVLVEKPCRRVGDKWFAPPLAVAKQGS
jgi:peptidoglycan/LPS O-acetylase OafA/YrhL